MSDTLTRLHADISYYLDRIAGLFDREHRSEVKLTLVIRTPWLPDGGVLMSDDEIESAVAEIERLRNCAPVDTKAPVGR